MSEAVFQASEILTQLKDFQRRTVDYVFHRFYLADPGIRRFLVADEVGLGKTMVARGLIARLLEHLSEEERIDIIYVCSNAAIASQNIARLNVIQDGNFALASRLTLLPLTIHKLKDNPVNFVSFTPGTTFDLKSATGVVQERALLFWMLHGETWLDEDGLGNLLQAGVYRENWVWRLRDEHDPSCDDDLTLAFCAAVRNRADLKMTLIETCLRFQAYRKEIPDSDRAARNRLIGELRQLLAQVCAQAMKPNLIILDEFQRFKELFDPEKESAQLADLLFRVEGARVLLLSATPYKMLSLDSEENEHHCPEFLATLRWLHEGDESQIRHIESDIKNYRQALYSLADGQSEAIMAARDVLQARLLQVMTRTERVGMTQYQDAMLCEPPRPAPLRAVDLDQIQLVDGVVQAVGSYDPIEYWKSSPYVVNFFRNYHFKRKLDKLRGRPSEDLLSALRKGASSLLQESDFESYTPVDSANGRLRSLFSDTLDRGMWRLLWLPPSLSYVLPGGAYAEGGGLTKALIFSEWSAVPDTISALCSYEAERRMLANLDREWGYSALIEKVKPPLRFQVREDDKPSGMSTLSLLRPSAALAQLVDPLQLAINEGEGASLEAEDARYWASELIKEEVESRTLEPDWGTAAKREAYWLIPLSLDKLLAPGVREWCLEGEGWKGLGSGREEQSESGLQAHLEFLIRGWDGHITAGERPDDLWEMVGLLALAGPGNCALRALHRIAPELDWDHPDLLTAAAKISGGFRTLFNLAETVGMLRSTTKEKSYWKIVLGYCLDGNLQALLDEQVHTLRESLGVMNCPAVKRVQKIAEALEESLSIRPGRLYVDQIFADPEHPKIQLETFNLRTRFALRFGDLQGEKESKVARVGAVRTAFNSPFRPFVLASTSIGQEGLDFHTWCHAVVHWNLPRNPVDLEQREGRVHRFKGHAVRKNIAQRFGLCALREAGWNGQGDPWELLFEEAAKTRLEGQSELVPYWLYETEGGAQIERRVPMLPFSREVQALARLKSALVLYRLVFGQPRQEDLLAYLVDRMPLDEAERISILCRISLSPPTLVMDNADDHL